MFDIFISDLYTFQNLKTNYNKKPPKKLLLFTNCCWSFGFRLDFYYFLS